MRRKVNWLMPTSKNSRVSKMDKDYRYIHIRRYGKDDDSFWPNPMPTGGYTICYSRMNANNEIFFTIARCRNDERYVRSIGREVALEKMERDLCFSVIVPDNLPPWQGKIGFIVDFAQELIDGHFV